MLKCSLRRRRRNTKKSKQGRRKEKEKKFENVLGFGLKYEQKKFKTSFKVSNLKQVLK